MADNYEFTPISSPSTQTDDGDFTPIHSYDYAPLDKLAADRDELANSWLSHRDFTGAAMPANVADLNAIKEKAAASGLSLDDVIAAAQEKESFGNRWALRLYRNGGPVYRGAVNSADSTATFLTNSAYRGLSYIPGWENLATEADKNNRHLQVQEAISDSLNREGSVASIVTPQVASMIGNVSQGVADIATVGAASAATAGLGGIAAGAAGAEVAGGAAIGAEAATGAVATDAATAGAAKIAAMNASKKAALYFGARTYEQQLTVATDHGMSPNMRLLHASMMGGTTAAFTYGFGQWANTLGLATSEQAMLAGKPAVDRLIQRSGLAEAIGGMAISGGEQASQEAAQMAWGSFAGTDNTDEAFSRLAKAGATGAAMRGSAEVLPAVRNFHDAYIKTQEAIPDTVKGTLDAQKAAADGKTDSQPPENASENYKVAYSSELSEIMKLHKEAHASLADIKIGEDNLSEKLNQLNEKKTNLEFQKKQAENFDPLAVSPEMKKQLQALGFTDEQIADSKVSFTNLNDKKIAETASKKGQVSPELESALANLEAEQKSLEAKGKELQDRRKAAETDVKAAQDFFNRVDDDTKTEIKNKVVGDLETSRIKNVLDDSKVNLTRAQNELNAQFRAQEGYAELPPTERLSAEQALQNARDKGYVARADDIAKDIVSTGRGVERDEQAGLVEASQHRSARIAELTKMKADPSLSESARNDVELALNEARKSGDVISIALNKGRANVAQTLALGKYDADHTSPANIRETARRAARGEISESVANDLTDHAVKLNDIQTRARQAAQEKVVKPNEPLTEKGFILREMLRAERQKGRPLNAAEESSITETAKKIYGSVGDIRNVDALRQKKVADDLYVEGMEQRRALDAKLLDLQPKTMAQKVGEKATLLAGVQRELLTGGDLVPGFRQGLLYPIETMQSTKAFFRALRSEREAILADKEVLDNLLYPHSQTKDNPLAIVQADAPLSKQEDLMQGRMAESIPYVGAFGRAFRVFLNTMRMKVFESQINANGGIEKWDSSNIDSLNRAINCGSGRGTFPGFENSMGTWAKIMIGPRFFWSRLQYFTGVPYFTAAYRGDKMASRVILKTYAKQVAGLAAMTTFAELMGKAAYGPDAVRFYRNPFSDDPEERFNVGRLRIGSTMIDITGGLARPFRYATALLEPEFAAAQNRPSLKRTGDTVLGIARGQLAPIPSALVSAGEVYAGKKTASGELANYIFPWSWKDAYQAVQDEGLDKGSAIAAFNMFGAGSYTTEKK